MLLKKLKNRILQRKQDGYNMPFYEEYIIRPLSFPITNLLLKTKITPNQVTIFSNFLIIVSSYLYYLDYKYLSISLIFFYFILDCVDGEIAREKNLKSEKGAIMEDKLPVIFLIGFYFLCIYIELGHIYSFLYLFSVHIINTLSFVNNKKEKNVSDNPEYSNWNRIEYLLRFIFSLVKSPVFFASALFLNIHIVLVVIVCSLSVTSIYKFYLLWKL